VDCIWGSWSAWTSCFAGKNQTRTREVNTTALSGGDECLTSDSSEKEPCRNILWFTFLLHFNDISVQNPLFNATTNPYWPISYSIITKKVKL
jgi:hypothetical protein